MRERVRNISALVVHHHEMLEHRAARTPTRGHELLKDQSCASHCPAATLPFKTALKAAAQPREDARRLGRDDFIVDVLVGVWIVLVYNGEELLSSER